MNYFSVGFQVTNKTIHFTRSVIVIKRQYGVREIAIYSIKCALPVHLLLYCSAFECVHCIRIKHNKCINYNEFIMNDSE